jgi:arylsulfatase
VTALRCYSAAFCLGVLEAILLYRLRYVRHYDFAPLEILNMGLVYAILLGSVLFLIGFVLRAAKLGPGFVSAASLAAIPVILLFRYQKYLVSYEPGAASLGLRYRLIGLALIGAAALGLGLLFNRHRRLEKGVTYAVWGLTAAIFLFNVVVTAASRQSGVEILSGADTPVNVVWITSDALRSDHMSSYGYERETSPVLEEFKKDAVFFRDNYSQCCWTQPSMISLFASLYPFEAFRMEGTLSPRVFTLAQILQAAGYRTVGYSNNEMVGPSTSLDRGFDVFYRTPRAYAKDLVIVFSTLSYVLDDLFDVYRVRRFFQAMTFVPRRRLELAGRSERGLFEQSMEGLAELRHPFFLYLHFMAPHAPYAPEDRWKDWGDTHLAPTEHLLEDARRMPPKDVTEEVRQEIVWRYDREIRMMDDYFGFVIRRLKELDLYDDCLVIFVSDHGEEFLEHGEWTHGRGLYQESVWVPLFIKLPGNRHGGASFGLPTQGVDLCPTVLEVLGIEPEIPYTLRGEPLFVGGGETLHTAMGVRPIVLEFNSHYPGISDQTALVLEGHKLIHFLETGAYELYDLANDPEERRNLAETEPARREELTRLMEGIIRDHHEGLFAEVNPLEAERVREELRALGYVK